MPAHGIEYRAGRIGRYLVALCLAVSASAMAAENPRAVIEAVQRTVISSELSDRVDSLPLRAGEGFSSGDVLVRLGCRLYRAERDKLSIKVAQAERRQDNRERLEELGSVGQLEVELARLAVDEARSELKIASLNVDRCTIRAPFDGHVVSLEASEFQSVKAQEKLLEIAGDELEARAIVPASWLSWLAIDQQATLRIDEANTTVTGRVKRIGAAVDPVSHTIPVWLSIPADAAELRPGMSGNAVFADYPAEAE